MSTNWKFRDCKEKPLLLFSCLDWGLGHTTRSVPLLKEFINLGCNLIVACNSIQKIVLEREFPGISFVELEGYGVNYAKTPWGTRFNLLWQLRKILIRIKKENLWLEGFIAENKVDGLISDNRYGLYHPSVPSIFITHQLQPHSGFGRLADLISQKFLYKFIGRFTTCWVPDYSDKNVLAGKLSHPVFFPDCTVEYIGPLSRFNACESTSSKEYDVLFVLSGPEPQRSLFEKMILDQAMLIRNKKIALVRGLPGTSVPPASSSIKIFNHLSAVELNELACESALVVCRPGYTTIMDMMKLKKKMVVVPTPGQPEQEYLARFLSANKYVLGFAQKKFNLQLALQKADNFTFNHIDDNMTEYKVVLKNFVDKISS